MDTDETRQSVADINSSNHKKLKDSNQEYDYEEADRELGRNPQGSQGSQVLNLQEDYVFDDRARPGSEEGVRDTFDGFDPNTTQTNALLQMRDNKFNLMLQQVYYSDKCSWFYVGLLVFSFCLIAVTVVDGFQVAESPLFITMELILNVLIGIDFFFRIKLVGWNKYVRDPPTGKLRWWNIFDGLVVIFCNLVFALSLFSKTGMVKGFEESFEEFLIVIWCIW